MAEIWELVNKNKIKTGVLWEKGNEDSMPKEMYHMAVEVWVKDKNNNLLLTQRHLDKSYGLFWECTRGSVIAGENSREGAVRELKEETGIIAEKDRLILLGDTIKSNFIIYTYLYIIEDISIELNLQSTEVVDAKFIFIDNIYELADNIVDSVWERFCVYEDKIRELNLFR